jgi:hypothetical protein
MKKIVLTVIILIIPCFSFAMTEMSNKELDDVIGANAFEPPMIAQETGGNATMLNSPVAMVQRTAEDVQTLLRPGTLASRIAGDTQTALSPSSDAQATAAGFGF